MNPIVYLCVAAALSFLYLAGYGLRMDSRAPTNRVFAALCFTFSIWNLGYTHMILSHDLDQAWFWYRVASVGWCIGPALLVHFFILISRNRWFSSRPLAIALLYLPGMVFLVQQIQGSILARTFTATPYGWDEVYYYSVFWGATYLTYYLLYSVIGLGMVWQWGRRSGEPRERAQARLILWTGFPVLGTVSVTNVLFRHLEYHPYPAPGCALLVLWGFALWMAIRRYNLMAISSSVASKDIIDTMADALLLTNLRGDVEEANPAAVRMFGRDRTELERQNLRDLFPGTALFETDALSEALSSGPLVALDLPSADAAGSPRRLSLSASLTQDRSGAPVGAVVIFRDITEQVNLHTRLVTAERAAQTDRLASVGMLAAGVAHEINNPLTYVVGNLGLLETEIDALLEEVEPHQHQELRSYVQEAAEGIQRVTKLVADLQSFARAKDDDISDVRLEDLLDVCLQMTKNQLKYRAHIVKEYGGCPLVRVNEGRLNQVFLNLLVNAAQAIEEGDPGSNRVTVRTLAHPDGPRVEIEDTGCGVPEAYRSQLFEPFFSSKPRGMGTGLGLAISLNIVTSLGGSMDLRDGTNGGTCFSVQLPPSVIPSVPTPMSDESSEGVPSAGGRVLVVDDEPKICSMLERWLRDRYTVRTAGSGEEAQQILDQDPTYDLILSDVMMPGISGIDLYRWIKDRTPEMTGRVVFMTGGVFTSRTKEFLEETQSQILHKPLERKEVERRLAEIE